MITKICPQCGKQFITASKTQKLCSRGCAFQSMSRKVHVKCLMCGQDMYIHKGERKFCSLKCAAAARHAATVKIKVCPVCSRSFECKFKDQQFCSRECANVGRIQPVTHHISEEMRMQMHNRTKQQWQDENFRQLMVNRMKSNNPVYMPGVVEKANATRFKNGSYSNNFKYGNGKISPHEQVVKDKLERLGFVYNKAIPTRTARDADPDAHYAINYKPDFTNFDDKLCIEIDGAGHTSTKEKLIDAKKEKCLKLLGYDVIRFTHDDIDKGEFDRWLNSYQKSM